MVVYISAVRKAASLLEWRPAVSARAGVEQLYRWIASSRELFT